MSKQINNYVVRVYEQRHPQFPPWVATATRTEPGKVYMFNVEGHSPEDVEAKARKKIETVA